MPNLHRGEIEAILDGCPHTLCLTLGALAELESVFGDEDILALAERLGRGKLSARDATRIIGAGLRGAGLVIADEAVAKMRGEGGAAGFVDIVARLLGATFGVSDTPHASAGTAVSASRTNTAAVASSAAVVAAADALPGSRASSSSSASDAAVSSSAREVRRDTVPFPGTR